MSWDAEVLIIGGGQAGLAFAQALAERGREALILDAGAEPGASWRSRYDSLRLFTPRRLSGLPGLALPGDPEGFPGKDELADYLLRYARHCGLSVRSGTRVGKLKRRGAGFAAVTAAGSVYTARAVIAAGGAFGQPRLLRYARHCGLSVRSGTRVGKLKRRGAGFAAVTAAGSVYTARAVIAAGGAFGQPRATAARTSCLRARCSWSAAATPARRLPPSWRRTGRCCLLPAGRSACSR
ncbi:NAD(P)-binding domain-containing protein [Paenibacillus mucilaginosus]|uniref:NAD(P)-binding domain-containing protein n=1 Tax=Paenibacillus mucilaginosus TaxID=61624 RepID=UPI000259699E|nr:NAD(P)-binding domain-containing protein [Paenibacillus mucilaginosus]